MTTFALIDDGTFDTVVKCEVCGAELRYTYDACGDPEAGEADYDAFCDWAVGDAAADHVCGENT
jgi:hypothetical protein